MLIEENIGKFAFVKAVDLIMVSVLVNMSAVDLIAASIIWMLAYFGAEVVRGQEDFTTSTPPPTFDQLRERAARQCSYRYSNNIVSLHASCVECFSQSGA